jgi:hypothetical protein
METIIYQFCIHNYKNEFEMLSRILYTIENYKEEMMPIESYCYKFDFLTVQPIYLILSKSSELILQLKIYRIEIIYKQIDSIDKSLDRS